uniref:Uncharacterized protein n=1 Tax=Nelumbo nucifera TaxID=4432 RepID=A0A822Y9D4_NELNU|nr:TPA_asm: hypothetical protein HUJ06_027666 [Nelumbo nucifera]
MFSSRNQHMVSSLGLPYFGCIVCFPLRIADKKGHHIVNDDGGVEPKLGFEA